MEARRLNPAQLVVGLCLLALGALLLIDQAGLTNLSVPWHRLWPYFLIFLGGVRLIWPSDRGSRWGSVWLLVVGLWAAASIEHWYGLSFHNSWPIFIIACGGMIVARAVLPADRCVRGPRDGQ